MTTRLAGPVLLSCALALAPAARAEVTWGGTGGFLVGLPQGAFGQVADEGFGGTFAALLAARSSPVALRLGGSFLIYGTETVPIAPYTGRVYGEVTTDNWIGAFEAGPELLLRDGPVRPYVHALVGVSYFATTSSLSDHDHHDYHYDAYDYTTNAEDWTLRLVAGGGVRLPVGDGGRLSLDLGARYVWHDHVSYLTEGDIVDLPGGGARYTPHRSRADLVELSVGLTWIRRH